MKVFYFFVFFIHLCIGFNPLLYKLKNPVLASSSLVVGKKYISTLSKININPNLSRKIIHISCAPFFIMTWPLYNKFFPQYWGSSVPFISSIYLIFKKNNLKKAISRSGNSNELLKGPLIYTIILTYITFYYWLHNIIGILTMLQLSVGDGFADIIGRKYGKHKWFFNNKKSVEGTIGFCLSSFFSSLFFIHLLDYFGIYFKINIYKLFLLSIFSSLIELIPYIDDNISIPLCIIVFNKFLLKTNSNLL